MSIVKQFEVGKKYLATDLYAGTVTYTVISRTENEITVTESDMFSIMEDVKREEITLAVETDEQGNETATVYYSENYDFRCAITA